MKTIIYTAVVMIITIYGYERFYKPRYGKQNIVADNKDIQRIMTRVENYLAELTNHKIAKEDIKQAVIELFKKTHTK